MLNMKNLDNLEKARQLKATPTDPYEIANMIRSAERRLADASNTALSYETRFDIIYNAAHALACITTPRISIRQPLHRVPVPDAHAGL